MQSGDVERDWLPPRDYFTDEIRRQLSAKLGDEQLFTGGLSIRATVDPELQQVAAQALRDGLERYDRGTRVYRGPVAQIDPASFDPADEASWRRALGDTQVPRDIAGWHPAVILSIGESSARIGIEGVEEDADGHFLAFADADWGRLRGDNGRLRAAQGPDDMWDVGDVVHVKAIEADGETRWSYRQIPAIQGGFMAMDTETGRVLAMQGGFSYQSSVFNRATQALRQPGSSFKPFVYAAALDNGYSPGDDRAGRPGRDRDRRRHLDAGERRRQILRPDPDPHRPRAVAQPDDRAHRPGASAWTPSPSTPSASASTTTCRGCSATRSAPARPRSTRW